ncbi:ATP-binding protein [Streptomyces sp. NPDC051940]|uniref:HAMP domain-containing sensor histidine kinase n=1 Tax=Streptomyces sp. NPDC051940 TaxID=3155675 RepID=UPI003434AA38
MRWGLPRRPNGLAALPGPLRGTARARYTALYATAFLLSGTALLGIAAVVSSQAGSDDGVGRPSMTGSAQARIAELERQLEQAHDDRSTELLIGSAIAFGVMAVVSVGLGWFVAGRVLRPLRMMTASTRRITAESLHERLAVGGPVDEVKDLADTIDDLLARLERSFEAQRLFVANASHELRTPLATMRASLDVALAKPGPLPETTATLAARMRAGLDQVDLLLESFLILARAQHGELADAGRLVLGRLVVDALSGRAEDIAARGLTVRESPSESSAGMWGSRTLLRRMVDNVIDNAIVHNDPEGWIGVAILSDEGEGQGPGSISLVVESGGPVLDQRRVADLAQPFRRLGADRTATGRGSGLGLSIVAAVAEAHDGTLDLRARPAGGLRVAVTLPRTSGRPARVLDAERETAR